MKTYVKSFMVIVGSTMLLASTPANADLKDATGNVYEGVREVVRGLTGGDRRIYDDGTFTQRERDAILRGVIYRDSRYDDDYDDHHDKKGKKQKDLPPGLQKKVARGGELPPGWQKKVARGQVMDSSVYQYRTRLPRSVLDDLRTFPGTSVIQVDDKVVRILEDSRTIIDVIDILQGR